MPASLLLLAAIGASPAPDPGLLIGLRSDRGEYRTVLVGRKGVATVTDSLEGMLLCQTDKGILSYVVGKEAVSCPETHSTYKPHGEFRVSWLSQNLIGLELDRSRPGDAKFSRSERQVLSQKFDTGPRLSSDSAGDERDAMIQAIDAQRTAAGPRFYDADLSASDWGFVRNDGHWALRGALVEEDQRTEINLGTLLTRAYGMQSESEVTLGIASTPHEDATDVVANSQARVAVVVTPTSIYVHDSNGRTVGRLLRRLSARNEAVVGVFQGDLDSFREYFAAHRTDDIPVRH